MPLLIGESVNNIAQKRRVLSNTSVNVLTTLTITAPATNATADILPEDETLILGRKIKSINNKSIAPLKCAYGRAATATDYDFILYGERQLLDIEHNGEAISAFLDAEYNATRQPPINVLSALIAVNYTNYIEI